MTLLENNAVLHMLLRMSSCLLAQSHCLPENLVYVWLELAPEGQLFECLNFISLYFPGLELTGVKSGIP